MNLLPHHFADPEAPLSLRHLPEFAPTQGAVHEVQPVIDRLPEMFDEPECAPEPLTTGELLFVWLISGLSLWSSGVLVWFIAEAL